MLACKYCAATSRKDGRLFTKQGQLNLHEYHCKMKNNVSRETKEEEKDCTHNFRLLTVSSSIEKNAYDRGYMEVCTLCQELR
jgi:hypothetical protein